MDKFDKAQLKAALSRNKKIDIVETIEGTIYLRFTDENNYYKIG